MLVGDTVGCCVGSIVGLEVGLDVGLEHAEHVNGGLFDDILHCVRYPGPQLMIVFLMLDPKICTSSNPSNANMLSCGRCYIMFRYVRVCMFYDISCDRYGFM